MNPIQVQAIHNKSPDRLLPQNIQTLSAMITVTGGATEGQLLP